MIAVTSVACLDAAPLALESVPHFNGIRSKINDTRLYRYLDRILLYKTKLERHLKGRCGELFGAEFEVLLYDLTSTYVEGAAEKNPMMPRVCASLELHDGRITETASNTHKRADFVTFLKTQCRLCDPPENPPDPR
jgi:hypothetical protein